MKTRQSHATYHTPFHLCLTWPINTSIMPIKNNYTYTTHNKRSQIRYVYPLQTCHYPCNPQTNLHNHATQPNLNSHCAQATLTNHFAEATHDKHPTTYATLRQTFTTMPPMLDHCIHANHPNLHSHCAQATMANMPRPMQPSDKPSRPCHSWQTVYFTQTLLCQTRIAIALKPPWQFHPSYPWQTCQDPCNLQTNLHNHANHD